MRTKRTELAAEREEVDAGEFPGSKKGVQEVAVRGSLFSLKTFSENHEGGPGKGSRKASKIRSERGYKLGVLSSGRGKAKNVTRSQTPGQQGIPSSVCMKAEDATNKTTGWNSGGWLRRQDKEIKSVEGTGEENV